MIRNVGGGRPGEIDRATLGQPGKYTFCFAEHEPDRRGSRSTSSAASIAEQSAVTLFAGEASRGIVDQLSRTPESLSASLAMCLRTVAHPKLVIGFDAMLVVSPEHRRVFREAGWSKARLRDELTDRLQLAGRRARPGRRRHRRGAARGPPRR